MPRLAAKLLLAAAFLAALSWRFPVVRFSRLDARQAAQAETRFDAADYAREFWTHRLPTAFDAAPDVGEVLAAIRRDPAAACRERGRTVGLSRACLYLVQGAGVVREATAQGLKVEVAEGAPGGAKRASDAATIAAVPGNWIIIATGPIFGNVVRDCSGLLDPATLADSRDLNEASRELNALAEERIATTIAGKFAVGDRIRFVACGQVTGKLPDGKPWKLIPLQAAAP